MTEKIGEMAEKAGDDCCGGVTCAPNIRQGMDVVASCGTRVGMVDRVENDAIKLTHDSLDGRDHHIPLKWIENVDEHVHLKINSEEVAQEWKAEPVGVGV